MPADPIEYRVIRNLQAALQAISIAAGYHFDVQAVAVKLDPNVAIEALVAPDGPRPFILIDVAPERWGMVERPRGLRLVMPVTIHWVSDSTPTVDESRQLVFLKGCADVEQAIALDITRGGLAFETRIVKREIEKAPDGAEVWAMVDTELVVHRDYGSPNG